MPEIIPSLMLIWLIAAALAGLDALLRKSAGISLFKALGLATLFSLLIK